MKDDNLSLKYRRLNNDSAIDINLKDIIGGFNLDQLEILKRQLDKHYKTIYNA